MVTESRPIFSAGSLAEGIDFTQQWMGWLFFITPFGFFYIIYKYGKNILDEAPSLLLFIWGGALLALTLFQRRFGEPFAAAQAILIGYFIVHIYGQIKIFALKREAINNCCISIRAHRILLLS